MAHDPLTRRLFLSSTLALVPIAAPILLGCSRARGDVPARDAGRVDASPSPLAVPRCTVGESTEANIEGPYYRDGAPFRTNLVDADVVGTPLVVRGTILSLDCKTRLRDAVIDVWQANGNGQYDNDGTLHLPGAAMRLRGKLRTGSDGAFAFTTVLPGHYLNGRRYRPAHIHVKVTAAGHAPLTTQLYFPDDPYNDGDPFIRRSLVMDVGRDRGNLAAQYDFTLRPSA